MMVNGREALMPLVRLDSYGPLIGVWKDMLAAAPTQGGGQLSGNTGELAEAVEVVTEWLAMAEAVPTQTHGVLRYPPISQGELDAIALLAKGGSHE
jgi:hypothetical protein